MSYGAFRAAASKGTDGVMFVSEYLNCLPRGGTGLRDFEPGV